jgi:magnesium chelatase subunit I
MNPEEGGLRSQLLDRFGLMVNVTTESKEAERTMILRTVLQFDEALSNIKEGKYSPYISEAIEKDRKRRDILKTAKQNFYNVDVSEKIARNCVKLADEFKVQGNRGDYTVALASRALASLYSEKEVTNNHVAIVAPFALGHRRPESTQNNQIPWSDEDNKRVTQILNGE